jgi:O-antigen/teichoic acid export membrane protein
METAEGSKTSPYPRRSAVRSGLLTGLSTVALSGSGAIAGAYLAHEFGRNTRTDGFMAAYGVYLVLTLGAQAFRLVVLPDLTRAEADGRLGSELRAYFLAFLALAVPVCVVVVVFRGPFGDLITGKLPPVSAHLASRALVWLVPAAFAQLLASVAASALAARGSYGTAALGFGGGGVVALIVFVALAGRYGLVSLAWSLALGAGIALAIPLGRLLYEGAFRAPLRVDLDVGRRLWRLFHGSVLPLAVQVLYLIALRLAAGTGAGNVTSLSYAYLFVAMLVGTTASTLGLISSAPLTRRGLDSRQAAEYVSHAAWISLVLIAAAASVFALVGGRVVELVLGHAYAGSVGRQLGHLVVYLSPWTVAMVAVTATFPLIFVMRRGRILIPLAVAAIALEIVVGLALRAAAGLTGIAFSLAISTFFVVAGLLLSISRRTLLDASRAIARSTLTASALAALAFGVPAVFLPAPAAAAIGLVLYGSLLVALRPRGLREAWAYVRVLH